MVGLYEACFSSEVNCQMGGKHEIHLKCIRRKLNGLHLQQKPFGSRLRCLCNFRGFYFLEMEVIILMNKFICIQICMNAFLKTKR